MTLKVRISQSSRPDFKSGVDLPKTFCSKKVLFTIQLGQGLTRKLLKNSLYRTVQTVCIIHTFARLMLVTFHTDVLVFPVVVSRRVSVTSFLLKAKSFFLKVQPPDCLKPARQGFFFVFTSSFFFSCFCFRNSCKRSNLSSTAVFFFAFSELLRTGTIF